jgi:hypothetical protein
MSVVTKDELHRLVEALPDRGLNTAARVLAALVADDPVGLTLALAPIDDEPETDEERAAVAEAEAASARGDVISHADVRREFGL